jgi:N6-adenosine-specific RNA methylase IME4
LDEGLAVMAAWGFTYKSNFVRHKIRKDGGPDGRGGEFYFRNVKELVFGVRGKNARACSSGPYLELFARGARRGWQVWGNQSDADYRPNWPTYKNNSAARIAAE